MFINLCNIHNPYLPPLIKHFMLNVFCLVFEQIYNYILYKQRTLKCITSNLRPFRCQTMYIGIGES